MDEASELLSGKVSADTPPTPPCRARGRALNQDGG